MIPRFVLLLLYLAARAAEAWCCKRRECIECYPCCFKKACFMKNLKKVVDPTNIINVEVCLDVWC